MSIFTPQKGANAPEILTLEERQRAVAELGQLRERFAEVADAEDGAGGVLEASHQSEEMHLCPNDAHLLRRFQNQDYSLPIRWRPRLFAMRLFRIDGSGSYRQLQIGRFSTSRKYLWRFGESGKCLFGYRE